MKKKVHVIISIISGLFLILDQWLKFFASSNPYFTKYLIDPWLGWSYFKNPGIAFGIPVPQVVIIPITLIILISAFWYLLHKEKNTLSTLYIILIIFGAISNLIDRILFSATIDYLRIITSVINLADVMIIVGAFLLLLEEIKKKTEKKKTMFNG